MLHQSNCKHVFKSGESQTNRQQLTQVWIHLINQVERSKATLAGIR